SPCRSASPARPQALRSSSPITPPAKRFAARSASRPTPSQPRNRPRRQRPPPRPRGRLPRRLRPPSLRGSAGFTPGPGTPLGPRRRRACPAPTRNRAGVGPVPRPGGPSVRKDPEPKRSALPLILVIGGVAAFVLLLVAGAGIGGVLYWSANRGPAVAANPGPV